MPTIDLNATQSCVLDPNNPTQNYNDVDSALLTGRYNEALLLSFEPLPANLNQKKIVKIVTEAHMRSIEHTGAYSYAYGYTLNKSFNENTATWSNYGDPTISSSIYSIHFSGFQESWQWSSGDLVSENNPYYQEEFMEILSNGLCITAQYFGNETEVHTARSSNKPYITVHYDTPTIEITATPKSGWINEKQDNTFTWDISTDDFTLSPITQSSAIFRWRTSSGSSATEINLTTEQSVVIPANTFSTDNIQWQVSVVTRDGDNVTSEWFNLTTVDSQSSAKIIAPKSSIINTSNITRFSWQHIIETGSMQSGFDVQYSANNGSSWITINTDLNNNNQYYDIPPNTLPGGELLFRVRTYNTDNVAGSWSDSVSNIVIAAPAIPSIAIDIMSPRPTVSWQSSEQQAYQIQFADLYDSGTQFGINKSFKSPVYLPDGQNVIRVRVQNAYGLWSDWGIANINVVNIPGESITLLANATDIVTLNWEADNDKYYIYRDGILIAATIATKYTDNFSIGQHEYQVRGVNSGSDNYTMSNTAIVTSHSDTIMISPVNNPNWQRLKHSMQSDRLKVISKTQNISFMNFAGSEYPSAEISEFKTNKYTFDVAFIEQADRNLFESLLGQVVCIKDNKENLLFGIISSYTRTDTTFMSSYSVTVNEIEYNEVIEHD